MIERGHGAGEVVGLQVGRRHGGGQTEIFGYHRNRREDRNGIHPIDARGQAERLEIVRAGRARGVGDEQHVELAALDRLRRLEPALDVLAAIIGGAREAPSGHVVVAVAGEKQGKLHLALGGGAEGGLCHGGFRLFFDRKSPVGWAKARS